jgi:hypothetical protein
MRLDGVVLPRKKYALCNASLTEEIFPIPIHNPRLIASPGRRGGTESADFVAHRSAQENICALKAKETDAAQVTTGGLGL